MYRIDRLFRWAGALGIALTPVFFFVLPVFLTQSHSNAEAQFRAIVDDGTGYADAGMAAQLVQLCGPVFLMLAAVEIGGFTIARGRGRTLGAIGLIVGMLGAVSAWVCLGLELGMLYFLSTTAHPDAAVTQALAWVNWPPFVISLAGALGGLFVALVILGLALWRSRVVPVFVPLLFLLPPLVGMVPIPGVAEIVSSCAFLVPCVWMAVALIRTRPESVGVTSTDAVSDATPGTAHRHAVER